MSTPTHSFSPDAVATLFSMSTVNDGQFRSYPKGNIVVILTAGQNSRRIKELKSEVYKHDPKLVKKLRFVELSTRKKGQCTHKKTATTTAPAIGHREYIRKAIGPYIATASLIVCMNFDVLQCILSSRSPTGNIRTLAPYRGSTYITEYLFGIPMKVMDDISKTYVSAFNKSSSEYENSQAQAIELFRFDVMNLVSLYHNTRSAISNFEETFNIVENTPSSISTFVSWLSKQITVALDFEVSLGETTCIGISGTTDGTMDTASTYLLPLVNPLMPANLHMPVETYLTLIDRIFSHPCPKFWHNMAFDLAQAMRINTFLRVPDTSGPHHDTMLMWNSLYSRLPQSLACLSSCVVPSYYFWKQEIKGSPKDKAKKSKYAVPQTYEGLFSYWQYCGRDCYNTLASAIAIAPAVKLNPIPNAMYTRMRAFALGPLMETNMLGVRLNREVYNSNIAGYREATRKGELDLYTASNGLSIRYDTVKGKRKTVHSNITTCQWLYDILGAEEIPAHGRTSAAPALSVVQHQSPLLKKAISIIHDYREPAKQLQSFQSTPLLTHRYSTSYSQLPYTGRLNSTSSPFFKGGNLQNITPEMRDFVLPEAGHILVEADYSAADLYHIAAACGDPHMMETVFDPTIDSHLYNASIFLDLPYDELKRAKDAKEDWVVGKYGVRPGFKPIGHGSNYWMLPATCAIQVGQDMIHAAAQRQGMNTTNWTQAHRNVYIAKLMQKYFREFPELITFRDTAYSDLQANHGHAECYGQNSCYFPMWNVLREKQSLTRELLAFYGQGGTAGMVNIALGELYYGGTLSRWNAKIVMQTHDSFTFSIPYSHYVNPDCLNSILTVMQEPCYFNDTEFVVPVEAKAGFAWGKSMVELPPILTKDSLALAALSTIDKLA